MNRRIQLSILFAVLSIPVCFAGSATANEFTEVIDSFDIEAGDMFDLNLSVGYLMEHRGGTITRETTEKKSDAWDFYAYRDMFKYTQVRHILDFNLEVGLFRDVSLRLGLPLILSDTRSITETSSWVKDGRPWDNDGNTPLFGDFGNDATFNSAKRSGVDYFSFGLWVNPLDQSREISFPTWTLFAEGHIGMGPVMRASCAKGQGGCVDGMEDRGGVSRGVNEVKFGMRLSRRLGIFDPYFGIDAMIGFPKGEPGETDFYASDSKSGQINTLPPIVGNLDYGLEITPWEQPAKQRRLVIGVGGGAILHSEGRDYTPLYDALGTSPYFNPGNYDYVDFNGNGRNDGDAEENANHRWTGMTDIENYATIFGQAFILMQPAKYIKFRVGGKWAAETEHFITKTDMCSIDLTSVVTGNVSTDACSSYNFGYRPELDNPGSRFRAEKTFVGTFYIDVTAMF